MNISPPKPMRASAVPAPAATTPAPAGPVSPGQTVGRATIAVDYRDGQTITEQVDVTAGPLLMSGIRDVHKAAMSLIGEHWQGAPRTHGLVGFFRNGSTWDAVALLAQPKGDKAPHQLWDSMELHGMKPSDKVHLGAIWQISHYGYDMGTPGSVGR